MAAILFLARGSSVSITWCCFIYTPEVYPTKVRSIAFGLGSSFIRLGGMITPYFAQVLLEYSEDLAIGIYMGVGAIATILPLCLPIESKGLDLSVSNHVAVNGNKNTDEAGQPALETSRLLQTNLDTPQ